MLKYFPIVKGTAGSMAKRAQIATYTADRAAESTQIVTCKVVLDRFRTPPEERAGDGPDRCGRKVRELQCHSHIFPALQLIFISLSRWIL